jgi:HAD-superfamily hydrolase, subfamily IIB
LDNADQYMIYFGGSVIQSYDRSILYEKTLKNDKCKLIAEFLTTRKVHFELIDNHGEHYDSYQDWIEKYMLNPKLGVVKFLLRTHKRDLDKLLDLMHTTYDKDYFIVKTSTNEMELFPEGVNKGSALEYLAKHLSVTMNQVMAIGDMDNDISMLKESGLGVAMGNASAEVKAISDVETTDNDHDGVAMAIKKYAFDQARAEID